MNNLSTDNDDLKVALINISVLTIDQMIMCNVKRLTCSDNPMENYHPSLQFFSVLASFSSLFSFYNPQLHCFGLLLLLL